MRRKAAFLLPFCMLVALLLQAALSGAPGPQPTSAAGPSYPILFVTQVPVRADFTTVVAVFGNHRGDLSSAPRGGDLWIRYPNGALKNLTAVAGFGSPDAIQGPEAIAVRDPAVHWSGTKALFSMVIGAPAEQYEVESYRWQIYEITGLGEADTPTITKVPNQPAQYNNVSPIYGTDDQIIFTTDRPRGGEPHLYPQLDEYETAPTNTGLWSLDPSTGDLRLLNHAPSGDFTPIVDSFGRVIFTQWDHLQRDQQADADDENPGTYGTFDYSDESAGAAILPERTEVFPEPRIPGAGLTGHTMNQFFPWQINEDGTESETLNHLGRHELADYIADARSDDPNIQYGGVDDTPILNFLQMKEDPNQPGRYYGIDAPEFGTHASGQVVILDAPPTRNAEEIAATYVTHRTTSSTSPENQSADPNHSGHYRDVLPMTDGALIAAHTAETRQEGTSGPSRYDFRLKPLTQGGNGFLTAGAPLTAGIVKSVEWWNPDVKETYSGPLWELSPVEVRPRTRPNRPGSEIAAPELQAFAAADVSVADLQQFLQENNLALVISRDVTVRDDADIQQPFNLRVVGGGVQTIGAGGKVYDVSHMQFFQAEQVRGWTGGSSQPRSGRRVLARPMRNAGAINPAVAGLPGGVVVAPDGSVAAFVPAGRATSWQIVGPAGEGVVRERYWLTFQAGEIRTCTSCHGQNTLDQAGHGAPANSPEALRLLLEYWKLTTAGDGKAYLPIVKH